MNRHNCNARLILERTGTEFHCSLSPDHEGDHMSAGYGSDYDENHLTYEICWK